MGLLAQQTSRPARATLAFAWAIAVACSPSTPGADSPPLALRETDVLLEIEGALPNEPAQFAFELNEPRHVTIRSVLSPVRMSWEVRDENGSRVSTRGRPLLAAGRYQIAITPEQPPLEPLLLKILTAPRREPESAADAGEARNASAADAFPLAPDSAVVLAENPVQLEHWFQVETSGEGVLLARLEGGPGGHRVELLPARPTEGMPEILASVLGGITVHAKVPSGVYHVVVRGDGAANPAPGGVLKVMHRTPDERPAGGVGIMTIGMNHEDALHSSLGSIAEATGLPLVSTQTADDILWVLATAIGEELGTDPRWALPGFLTVSILLFGLAERLRRRRLAWTKDPLDADEGNP
ncbi:MAG: hypothetical protein GY723_21980 [bacterium]|nr:hypothetical protein [bacterium]